MSDKATYDRQTGLVEFPHTIVDAIDVLQTADLIREASAQDASDGDTRTSEETIRDSLLPVIEERADDVDRVTRMTAAGILTPHEARAALNLP